MTTKNIAAFAQGQWLDLVTYSLAMLNVHNTLCNKMFYTVQPQTLII